MMHWKLFFAVLLFPSWLNAQAIDTIPMVWEQGHSALLLPVNIGGQSRYMQFDLGAPNTLFYKNAVAGTIDILRDFSFLVGTRPFMVKSIPVTDATGSSGIAGTLGADFIDNRVVIFDYPHNRLLLADSLPRQYAIDLQPFYFPGGRVLLPVRIAGKQTLAFFDTGSSAFALLTDSASCSRLAAKDSAVMAYPVNSWGRTLTVHSVASADSIVVSSRSIPLGHVAWISGTSAAQEQQMRQMGIGGMIGNALFLDRVLILDMRKQRFGMQ